MSNERNKIVGKGWGFPPVFVKGMNQVVMTHDVRNINENLKVLFSTHLGERPTDHHYGTTLKELVFSGNDIMLEHEVKESLETAIKLYEPRIILDAIQIDSSAKLEGMIAITIFYTVREVNSRHNFVYPYYISEGTNLEI
ncbi:GPW/gp25 family protein [Ekhidna sp.]|uniref:GPW/gp25 family protein n=1 Tax=Ekhidna sp. TaxID=2608089 RepID=UPI003296E1B4